MTILKKLLLNLNTSWKIKAIAPYINSGEKVLDFGCGDLSLCKQLKKIIKEIDLTGIDTQKFSGTKPKNIKMVVYDGKKLPFANNAFDSVISVYVFHHCSDPFFFYKECYRVAKKKVVFVEAIARHNGEIPLMKFADRLFNLWKPEHISIADKFYTLVEWTKVLTNKKDKIEIKEIPTITSFLPIGKGYLFVVSKSKK